MRRSRWDDWDEGDEPAMAVEAVERRREPRGIVRGLALQVPADGGHRVDAVEASSKGFFARVPDPEAFRLGDVHDVAVVRAAVTFRCTVEVVRKEIAPRPGVAFRIVRIAPDAQLKLTALVADD
jgi:hypothetical protein